MNCFENSDKKYNNFTGWHEMLENENQDALGRLHDLERKVLEQRDELVCLKATLAEALRRISVLEGWRHPHQVQPPSTPPATPIRNGFTKEQQMRLRQTTSTNTTLSSTKKKIEVRELNNKSYGSSLPQRRAVRYQSTGSLHSDSHSSSSISPVPSPSPRATPLPLNVRQQRPTSVQHSHPPLSPSSASGGGLHKRWSSTGDFNNSSALSPQSKFSTKSFLNLFPKQNGHLSPNLKHGCDFAA